MLLRRRRVRNQKGAAARMGGWRWCGQFQATMYQVLGIDYKHAFYDQAQRPLPILSEGEAIGERVG